MSIERDRAKAAEMAEASTTWSTAGSGLSLRILTGAAAATLGLVLAVVSIDMMGHEPGGLTSLAQDHLAESGVDNAVTAVLLNFRSVDTWLELGVLVLAVMAMLALQRTGALTHLPRSERSGYVLRRLTGIFVPLMVLGAGYLLWRGTHAPGGAFQAGALLGAAGVMMSLSGRSVIRRIHGFWLRAAIVFSFFLFGALGLTFLITNRRFLEYPTGQATDWIFITELAAALSIGVALWALFVGAHPAPWRGHRRPDAESPRKDDHAD